ncbi:alpha/beta fold hydrolase [Paenibacillus sp. CAU 1782]
MLSPFKNDRQRSKVLDSYDELLKLWDAQVESRYVESSYGRTHVLLAGKPENPPLMLFHGVGDNAALMWALNIGALSDHFYCIAVDTLGGPGKSEPGTRFNQAEFDCISWLEEVREGLRLGCLYAAGVSNGAYIAYRYAAAKPDIVLKAVCMEGGMIPDPLKAMFGTVKMMFPELLWPTDRNLRRVIAKLSSPESDVFERYPALAEHLVLLMRSHNQRAMFPHKPQKYISGEAASLRHKLYFLLGDHHTVAGPSFVGLLEFEGLRYSIVKRAGHAINHEQPEIVHKGMLSFLLQTSGA